MDRTAYELSLLSGKTEDYLNEYSKKSGISLLVMKEYFLRNNKLPNADMVGKIK